MISKRMKEQDGDVALQARRRMETRGKRRLARRILARNAQWRRRVTGGMAAGTVAWLAGLLLVGEAVAMAA